MIDSAMLWSTFRGRRLHCPRAEKQKFEKSRSRKQKSEKLERRGDPPRTARRDHETRERR